MQINYFNPSELAESPKAEDFRYGPPPRASATKGNGMKFTFNMSDAWGDDYRLTVTAETLAEATKKATLAADDAIPSHLIKVSQE